MKSDRNLLIVEDNPGDAYLLQDLLSFNTNIHNEFGIAACLSEALQLLKIRKFDAIILDLNLPDSHGVDTIRQVAQTGTSAAIVVMTGLDDEQLGIDALELGAQDYLVKGKVDSDSLNRAIAYAITRKNDQNRINHLYRVLGAIRNVNQLITHENNQARLIHEVCELLVSNKGYFNSWILLVNDDRRLIQSAHSGYNEEFKKLVKLFYKGNFSKCIGEAFETDGLVLACHTQEDCVNCPLYPSHRENGTLIKKLVHKNELFGLIGVSMTPEYVNDKQEHSLFVEVADDIAYALHTIKQEQETKRLDSENKETRRQLNTLINNIPGFAFRCRFDAWCTMEYMSDACYNILGYKSFEITDNEMVAYVNLIHPEDRDKVYEEIIECLERNGQYTTEYRIVTKDKKVKWLWEQGVPILNEQGDITHLEGYIAEITQQHEALSIIRENERHFESLLNNPVDYVIFRLKTNLIPLNPKVTHVSPSLINMLGIDYNDLNNYDKWLQNVHPDDLTKLIEGHHKINQPPFTFDEIMRYHHPQKGLIWLRAQARGIPSEEDVEQIEYLNGILTDISYIKKYEHELLELNDELTVAKDKAEESDRLKSAFLANMSHEIRTPMNAILGFANVLGRSDLSDEKRKHFMGIVKSSGNQLLHIINDIVDLSKLEAGQLKMSYANCVVCEMLKEAVEAFANSEMFQSKPKIKLKLKIPSKCYQINLDTDPVRLRQVVDNLITNAIKYTEKGFVEVGMNLRTSKKQGEIIFYVKDSGVGIPADKFKVIFERFRQVEENGFHHGTGLGLSISKGIVKLLGGEIWFDSKVGKGSSFYFSVPVDRSKLLLNKEENQLERLDLNNKTILIAEDDYNSYIYLKELLSDSNAKLIHAADGQIAMDMISKHQPDLVLLDIGMPAKNGFECLDEIRSKGFKTRVIAQTAFALDTEREKCLAAGCDGYIAKPIEKAHLFSIIKRIIHS